MKYLHPIFDCHIHFGQFRDSFYSEEMLADLMGKIGVERYFIMPISTSGGKVDFVKEWEYAKKIVLLSKGKAMPALLIGINMIKSSPNLSSFDEMPYKYLKIHGYMHDWHKHPELLQKVFDAAIKRKLPIMLHTGGRKESEPLQYLKICKKNPSVTVILAHGRPIDQTTQVMEQCPNAWADTAFMPVADLVQLVNKGFEDRILFGSDHPIIESFYPETNLVQYYFDLLEEFSNAISPTSFEKITYLNFNKLFNFKY
jgi:hypothetical protein